MEEGGASLIEHLLFLCENRKICTTEYEYLNNCRLPLKQNRV